MPPSPRLREQYRTFGPAQVGDTELLTLVLGTGTRHHSARSIAARLLDQFGTLQGIREAPVQALAGIPGVGPARATRVHAALHLAGRARLHSPAERIDHPEAVVALLRPRLEERAVEVFWAVYLDVRLHVLDCRELSRGSARCTVVDPVEVFRPALLLRAAALTVAHNHPSGHAQPSQADHALTRRLVQAGQLLGVPVLDHVVIGRPGHWSFAEEGALPTHVDLRGFTGSPRPDLGFRPFPAPRASPG